jgi:hypothetical protein
MSVPSELEKLVGEWQGTNLLWLSEQPIKSETTATVKSAAGGTCLCVEYVWKYEGEAQEGILLLGSQGEGRMQGIWRDSWHSSGEFMISDGKAEGPDQVQILSHYAAPPGPDWGWRTHLRSLGNDRFEIAMVNISPEGEEDPAVRMEYRRIETPTSGIQN